jgi:hypothetical protein
MKKYEIELAHGPVIITRYLGGDKVRYILFDGRVYDITFSRKGNVKDGYIFCSEIVDENGKVYHDEDYGYGDPLFTEGEERTTENFAQFVADNFEFIEEFIEFVNKNSES